MKRRAATILAACGLVMAACGGDDDSDASASTSEQVSTIATEAPAATEAATTAAADTTEAMHEHGEEGAAHEHGEEDAAHAEEEAPHEVRTTYPLTIDNCGVEVTFDKAPERVLILNGTSVAEVETFIALGIEDHILANSQSYGHSDIDGMLAKIAAIPTGGLTLNENFEVPKEQTLALEPDLVISTWAGGFSEAMGSATREQLAEVGINSYVTPVNCAYGAENPDPKMLEAYANQTYEASFDLVEEIGLIFDVQHDAEHFIEDARAEIAAASRPAGADPVNVLVAYPGMSMMNPNGIPQVFVGPFTDSIIEAGGGVNAFDGYASFADATTINAEALAAADVDVLMVGLFMPGEDADLYAADIFAKFPQWDAAKNNAYTSIAESFYLGPYNSVGIAKIADAIAALG